MTLSVPNIRDYGCGRIVRRLDSYLASELSVEGNHEILEHLDKCPACRRESDARERLRVAIRRVSIEASEPRAEFEARVRTLVSKLPSRSRARQTPTLLLIAAVVVTAVGLALALRPNVPNLSAGDRGAAAGVDAAAFDIAARTQANCALKGSWPTDPPSVEELGSKLEQRFLPALHTMETGLPGYRVNAVHRCGHGGREVQHFVLRRQGQEGADGIVSVVALQRTNGSLPMASTVAEGRVDTGGLEGSVPLRSGRGKSFDIAATESKDLLLFVVSSLGREESVKIGRAVFPPLVAPKALTALALIPARSR